MLAQGRRLRAVCRLGIRGSVFSGGWIMTLTDLVFEMLIKLGGIVENTVPYIVIGFES
jgi:hypothetical protein